MCVEMIRRSQPKENKRSKKRRFVTDTTSMPPKKKSHPEQVRIFIYCIYFNSTHNKE